MNLILNSNEYIAGIDLGTTNSLIAIANKNGNVEVLKDEKGREILPSTISYENNTLKVGYDVNSTKGIYSIKRLMGKNVQDICKNNIHFEIDKKSKKIIKIRCADNKYLTPIEISAEILKALCKRAKKCMGIEVKKAVITVPAYFDDSARNATKYAAKLAGIEVISLINEPTAAALSYSIEKNNKSGLYAVYDLGGGTFDISILKLHQGVFQVLAVGGDTKIGGDDFDHLLGSIILNKYKKLVLKKKYSDLKKTKERSHSKNFISNDSNLELLNKQNTPSISLIDDIKNKDQSCFAKHITKLRIIKEHLSDNSYGIFTLNIFNESFKCKISKKEFEKAISSLVKKTINIVIDTINDINLKINDIKGVIVVGGSTRIPLIHKSLLKLFGNKKILNDVDPDKAVVIGAALQAHYLTTSNPTNKNIILDVLPLSLGIETMGGIFERIIPRNTPLPASETKEFTTYTNGQTGIKIHVFQGEREMIKDNKSLAQFELKGIPPMPAGC